MALAVDPAEVARLRAELLDRYGLTEDDVDEPPDLDDRAEQALGISWEPLDVDTFGDVDDVRPDGASWGLLFELLDRHRPAWQADALCREYVDTVTWFPERGESAEPAKAVCSRCPCAAECNAYAADTGAKAGIWAGEPAGRRKRARTAA